MSLTSLKFGVFLLILFVVYFCFPKKYLKYQWVVLLVGSYIFYLFSGVKIMIFLIISTFSTWAGALILGKMNQAIKEKVKSSLPEEKKVIKRKGTRGKRWVLFAVLAINFGILFVLKYSGFAIQNLNIILQRFGFSLPTVKYLLPLGISFYTFQSAGYIIDVYRGKYAPDRNFLKYALFVSYFPQIIQGPISRHDNLAVQLYESHRFNYQRFTFGLQRALWGYFKKMVIADRLAVLTTQLSSNYTNYEGFTVFLGVLFYTLQIYADFSGGMDVICGISESFGIDLVENFKRPYFSTSVSEFWQRWHITLGSWMREYVFYPLALSKPFSNFSKRLRKPFGPFVAKVLPTSIASLVVFLLVGIWHGAGWNYLAYGVYQSIFVSTGTLLQPIYTKCKKFFRIDDKRKVWKVFQTLRTVLVVSIARYFIHAPNLSAALYMMKATVTHFNPWIFTNGSLYNLGLSVPNFNLLLIATVFLFIMDYIKEKGVNIREAIARQRLAVRWTIYLAGIFAVIIFGMYGPGYVPSDFIYQAF